MADINCESLRQIAFWPAEEVDATFKRMKEALDKPFETQVQEMREFTRKMFLFYETSSYQTGVISSEEITALYDMAEKSFSLPGEL